MNRYIARVGERESNLTFFTGHAVKRSENMSKKSIGIQ